MIPKIIHYCWFGRGEKPELAKRCIASWRKFCPEFEIREWNEDNCDYLAVPFMAEAYAAKKYAFVTDVMRLLVLEQYGGVYFDTDVEVVRDISPLLNDEGFIGFENDQFVNSGQVMAAVPHQSVVQAMIAACRGHCEQVLSTLGATCESVSNELKRADAAVAQLPEAFTTLEGQLDELKKLEQ